MDEVMSSRRPRVVGLQPPDALASVRRARVAEGSVLDTLARAGASGKNRGVVVVGCLEKRDR